MAIRWTPEEIEFLSDKAGFYGYDLLCKKLGRSKNAIKLFACKRGIRFHDNVYTSTLLAKELGRSRSGIRKYYKRGWIKGVRASWKSVYGKSPVIFKEEDIVEFLRERFYLFDYKKVPNLYFRNIIKEEQNGVQQD